MRRLSALERGSKMAIYYIADTHFGHKNIIKLCSRPFASVEEMNERLVENWNKRVKGNDKVYILGDLFYKAENVETLLSRLKGKKYLLLGNHDASWLEEYTVSKKGENSDTLSHKSYRFTKSKRDLSLYFQEVSDIMQISDGGVGCILCHYPLLTWKHEERLIMIHGHLHDNITDPYFHHIAENEKMLNAGVEINGYMPVTLCELIENNKKFKESVKGE